MSDYIPDQQKILEQIADEENISFLRAASVSADETVLAQLWSRYGSDITVREDTAGLV
jgi:hypothetical protein